LSDTDTLQPCKLNADYEELDHRQLEVLEVLSKEEDVTYSFQGLRRKLGLHQEVLSRTLDRLEDQNLVVRTNDGYRMNPQKDTFHFGYVTEAAPIETKAVTAYLPCDLNVSFVLNALKGRWFGEFRWLGYSETPSGLGLSWITDDGRIQLRVKILKKTLTISALYESKSDQERATISAYELFDFITRATKQRSIRLQDGIPN
jgi:hypothetical protein